jgi:hypothetical protein
MRWAVIAGVLGAALPTLASAQVKVALGDGVSVVFPGAPIKMHTTVEQPPGAEPPAAPRPRPAGQPPMPVPPVEHDFRDFRGGDSWMFHEDGATFAATAIPVRGSRADLPATCGPIRTAEASGSVASCRVVGSGPAAMREDRRTFGSSGLRVSRWISHGGRAYLVTYMRVEPKAATAEDAAGDRFLASLSVSGAGAK